MDSSLINVGYFDMSVKCLGIFTFGVKMQNAKTKGRKGGPFVIFSFYDYQKIMLLSGR